MKIKILSDLHLEGMRGYELAHPKWATYNNEDVLVLAGDIAVGIPKIIQALEYFKLRRFPKIIYVAGNHEFYHHDMDMQELKRQANSIEGVHMLTADEIVKIDDVSFFGGTLWTNFGDDPISESAARRGINDFRVIGNWDTQQCAKEYYRQSQYIKHAYENTKGKKVIVTHFLPAQECVSQRYRGTSTLNSYFANSLDGWIETLEDTVIIYGHTHDPADFKLGNTRLVCNPLGYYGEYQDKKFNPIKSVEF